MLAFLSSILPALATAAITAYNKSKDVTIATVQGAVTVTGEQLRYMTAALDHPLSPVSIICYVVAARFVKIGLFDNMICSSVGWQCSTPALAGTYGNLEIVAIGGMFAIYSLRQFTK